MSKARLWAPSVGWALVILVATSLPASTLPSLPAIPGLDKLVHAFLYGVLGALAVRPALATGRGARSLAWLVIAIAAFAALDEVHQLLVPGRSADPFDWMADMAGALLGMLLRLMAPRRRETRT
jgi:VanZ family protein